MVIIKRNKSINQTISKRICGLQMVQLALELLVSESGEVDQAYCATDLSDEQNVSVLQKHLSSAFNADLAGPLSDWAHKAGEPTARLLRLACRREALHLLLHNLLPVFSCSVREVTVFEARQAV